jgi:hypothetical protein
LFAGTLTDTCATADVTALSITKLANSFMGKQTSSKRSI